MGTRFALRLGLILTGGLLILLLAMTGLGSLLPDAGQLGFETDDTSAYYMLDVARRIQHPIIHEVSGLHSWSNDGSRLAYVRPLSPTRSELMLKELYGSTAPVYPVNILHPPLWSPDNQALAFTDTTDLLQVEAAARSREPTRLTDSIPEDAYLHWDTSGHLRFVTPSNQQVELYEITPNDPEPRLVRTWPVKFLQTRPPVFAPDGNRFIVPAIRPDALNLELYLFDVEADAAVNLSNRPLFNDSGAVWSPDGTAIVYQSHNDAGQFLILYSLTSAEQSTLLQVESGFIRNVIWSPDQASVSFFLSYSGQQQICIFTLASENMDCPIPDAEAMTWRPMG